ncbi:uncharacterized protein F5Z01DRAFT_217380 [Emericellopsis atlantica]|uniref:Uncharacterized protein n=1 Tax=Emericellopsis atlantica TaxID=2614577 RepID=A0A9P7ZVT3_9HYPO|nr:uncharacterized protein F5Z01DRAFT_217380 [Emericellopsis atlantica]KAG9258756.1 hypothetical protein F5Z01DRAFT_217380 [Emericellopsis atlantica]
MSHALISHTALRALILTLIYVQLPFASSLKIFPGDIEVIFANTKLSDACKVALNRDVRCPIKVRGLSYPDHALEWTVPELTTLCGATCRQDVTAWADGLKASCQSELLEYQHAKVSLAEFGEMMDFRAGHLCIREGGASGEFCVLAPRNWDVKALESANQATWPQHTSKCLLDEDGTCTTPEVDEFDEPSSVGPPDGAFLTNDVAALDFYRNRSQALEDARRSSLGWNKALYLDEFPLEIQCKRCFWRPLALAHQSKWGRQIWEYVTDHQGSHPAEADSPKRIIRSHLE